MHGSSQGGRSVPRHRSDCGGLLAVSCIISWRVHIRVRWNLRLPKPPLACTTTPLQAEAGDCPKSWRRHRLSDVIYVRVTLLLRRLVMKRQGWTSKLPTPLEQRQHIRRNSSLNVSTHQNSHWTLPRSKQRAETGKNLQMRRRSTLSRFSTAISCQSARQLALDRCGGYWLHCALFCVCCRRRYPRRWVENGHRRIRVLLG